MSDRLENRSVVKAGIMISFALLSSDTRTQLRYGGTSAGGCLSGKSRERHPNGLDGDAHAIGDTTKLATCGAVAADPWQQGRDRLARVHVGSQAQGGQRLASFECRDRVVVPAT